MRIREASLGGNDIREEISRDGFVVLGNIPLTEPRKRLEEILSRFGTPTIEDASDVKPKDSGHPLSTKGSAHFGLHTDRALYPIPPEYIGLLCLSRDTRGGESLLADARDGLRLLTETQRDALRTTTVRYPTPRALRASQGETVDIRVLDSVRRQNGDHHILRYRYGIDEIEGLSPLLKEALRSLLATLKQTMRCFALEPQQALLFSNEWMLHGRTEIVPDPGTDVSKRHLIRMFA